jgi:hypothetical protein
MGTYRITGAKRLGAVSWPSELALCTQLAAESLPPSLLGPAPLAVQQLGYERQSTSPSTRSFLSPKSKQMRLDVFYQSPASIPPQCGARDLWRKSSRTF